MTPHHTFRNMSVVNISVILITTGFFGMLTHIEIIDVGEVDAAVLTVGPISSGAQYTVIQYAIS